jgi:hypothetical protein
MLFGLTVLTATLPISFHQLRTPCVASPCSPLQLTPEQAQVLRASLSLSLDAYALCVLAFQVASSLIWVGVGIAMWQRFDRVIVVILAVQGLCQGIINPNAFAENGLVDVLARAQSSWLFPAMLLQVLGQVLLLLVFTLFPTGRFVPRWTRWVAGGWVVIEAAFLAAQSSPALRASLPRFNALFLPIILLSAIALTHRYRHVSTVVEQQQIKWIVVGFVASNALEIMLVAAQPIVAPPSHSDSLYAPAAYLILLLGFSVLPATTYVIAVLRYRLYDIDFIIRRTLVYGTLTASLAAVYFAVVVGTQTVVGAVAPGATQSPVIIVASTLLIALLFTPLRHILQAGVDRRFYRTKYDAERVLEAFGATLRAETDLEVLTARLVSVVEETMQPEHVSIWLRSPDRLSSQESPPPGPPAEGSASQGPA